MKLGHMSLQDVFLCCLVIAQAAGIARIGVLVVNPILNFPVNPIGVSVKTSFLRCFVVAQLTRIGALSILILDKFSTERIDTMR